MEPLVLEPTSNTPHISFDPRNGLFVMTGRSIPEHPVEFYSRVTRWVERYVEQPRERTIIRLQFEYFNTSSSRCIMDILKKLSGANNPATSVLVEWFYERQDIEMKETGEDFCSVLKLPFSIIMTG